MVLLSWACQPEGSGFSLQLVYISKEPFLSTIITGHSRRFEQRCVEIKFKGNQAPAIARWLVSRNPDLWKMNELVRISPPKLKGSNLRLHKMPEPWQTLAEKNKHPRDDNICFYEPTHTYYINGSSDKIISCTGFIHSFFLILMRKRPLKR
jgi:hypothetical protein